MKKIQKLFLFLFVCNLIISIKSIARHTSNDPLISFREPNLNAIARFFERIPHFYLTRQNRFKPNEIYQESSNYSIEDHLVSSEEPINSQVTSEPLIASSSSEASPEPPPLAQEQPTTSAAINLISIKTLSTNPSSEDISLDPSDITSSIHEDTENTLFLQASLFQFDHPTPPTPPSLPPARLYPTPKRLALSHVDGFGAGTGYGTNYSSATVFLASDYRVGHVFPFIDLRGHHFDNNTYGANVGIGGRYVPENDTFCSLLGFNAYYDYREGYRWNYNQVGLGLEILGKRLDFRANMYFPFGIKKYSSCCVYDDYTGDWEASHCRCESISYGYNAEVGYLLVRSRRFLLYAATGPYYFSGKCLDRTAGWEFRIRPQYQDYFAIDGKVSYDRLYHTVFQLSFIVSVPLYQIRSYKEQHGPCGITDRQIYQPVIRQEAIPISKSSCWQSNFDEIDNDYD